MQPSNYQRDVYWYYMKDGPPNWVRLWPSTIAQYQKVGFDYPWIECGSAFGVDLTPYEVIEVLENYHTASDAEADAMGYDDCARFHSSIAKWLRKDAKRLLLEE